MAGKGNQDAEILREFVMESRETLARVEPLVNELAAGTEPCAEKLAVLFRCFHSFKGTASFLGLRHTAGLAHGAESLLELFRRGAPVEQEHVPLLRSAVRTFGVSLDVIETGATDEARSTECHEVTSALGRAVAAIRAAGVIPVSSFKRPTFDLIEELAESPARGSVAHSSVVSATLTSTSSGDDEPDLPVLSSLLDELSPLSERDGGTPALRGAIARGDGGSSAHLSNEAADGGHRAGGSIRVDPVKLDTLLNLVGELAIVEVTVTKNPDLEGHDFENFQRAALNLTCVTRALQDTAMALRRVPIEGTFRKLGRLVGSVASKQRKRVELATRGADTEVDRKVVETIRDSLVHLVRNAVDHGIELPEERTGCAKAPVGTVVLDARHQGGEVWLTVCDDGRGLDAQQILAKAVERGLADPTRRYSEREIYEFIFMAGFSIASRLTDTSGRGAGLDVVRRTIEAVNGRIDVSSELGKGTTFTLRIPPTLAIVEGMSVRVVGATVHTCDTAAGRPGRLTEDDVRISGPR